MDVQPFGDFDVSVPLFDRGEDQQPAEESNSQQSSTGVAENQSHFVGPPQNSLPEGVSDIFSAVNQHSVNHLDHNSGHVNVPPNDSSSSRPEKCPTEGRTAPPHQSEIHGRETATITSQPSGNGGVDFRNHFDDGQNTGVSNTFSAVNQHAMDHWANAPGCLCIAPSDSSNAASRPEKCPANDQSSTRGDGSGYKCPICGKKTRDCNKSKCLLPLFGPGIFKSRRTVHTITFAGLRMF